MRFKGILLFFMSFLAGLAVVLTIAGFTGFGSGPATDAVAKETGDASFAAKTTGSLEDGDIEIQLTPLIKGDRLVVQVGMNTHSVDLGQFDLKEVTVLEYNGKVTKPVEAKEPRGHHAYGKIVFIIEEEPERFTIRIKGIPNIPERIYEWSIN